MQESVISSKYQVVIPKSIRKQLRIAPGQKVTMHVNKSGSISVTPILSPLDKVKQYAGSMPGAWGSDDPAEMIRKDRDASNRGINHDRRS